MTSWPSSKCKPGDHRWQNGQCIRCGTSHTSVAREQTAAIGHSITGAAHAIIDFLVDAGHADAAQKVADEFLTFPPRGEVDQRSDERASPQ